MMKKVKVLDTTLRDGTQMEGFSLGVLDKITIAKALDDFGIDYIEGGWPGSNPRDIEFFEQIKTIQFQNARLMAFCSTHHKKFLAENDPNLQKTIESGSDGVTIFGKTWRFQAEELLEVTGEENCKMIENSIRFLTNSGLEVFFDAEHFFDGFFDDEGFALECLFSAIKGGAKNLSLCDTNGGMTPDKVFEVVEKVKKLFPQISLGIHAHNDGELAVANSLAAIKAGADLVQGTINGVGERCGNANLCSVLPNLELKMKIETVGTKNLKMLKKLSELVAERGNMRRLKNLPFVGKSAFSHKGGIHVSAVRKFPKSYEAISPESVGNERRITISDLSGRSNILEVAKKMGISEKHLDEEKVLSLLKEIKEREKKGLQFEGAEASFELLFRKYFEKYLLPFSIENFFVHTSKFEENKGIPVEATVSGKIGEKSFHTAGYGQGPVGALDEALRKALEPEFPILKKVHLIDFKVRIVEMDAGTGAKTRVVIESTDGETTWRTVGCSQNIIEASMNALCESFEWRILFLARHL